MITLRGGLWPSADDHVRPSTNPVLWFEGTDEEKTTKTASMLALFNANVKSIKGI